VTQSCKDRRPKTSGNIYNRHRRLDLRAVARVFYIRRNLTQAKELGYAASKLTSLEINGTYYGSQKPESFRKWAREGARWLYLLAGRPALRHQSPRTGRGRRVP